MGSPAPCPRFPHAALVLFKLLLAFGGAASDDLVMVPVSLRLARDGGSLG